MDNYIKFSIVIPTLNSESVLSDTLNSLLPQVYHTGSIEIIIINNGSTDNTQTIIDEYKKYYPSLIVINRDQTIPARENFRDGVHRASGEYVLLLGDDDIVFPSFTSEIMPLLEKKYGLIHYNRVIGLNNLNDNRTLFRNINKSGFLRYDNYSDFLNDYCADFNFMSSVIFRKDIWMKGETKVSYDKPYYGYFWYATLVFGAVHNDCLYYSYPLVIQRVREQTWKAEWTLYWIVGMFSIYKDLDAYVPGIYSKFYKTQHDKRKDYFLSLFAGIANNKVFYRDYKMEFFNILTPNERRLFNLILKMPSFVGVVCQKIYRFFLF